MEGIQEETANTNGYLRACLITQYSKIYTYMKAIQRKYLNNGLDRDPSELFYPEMKLPVWRLG